MVNTAPIVCHKSSRIGFGFGANSTTVVINVVGESHCINTFKIEEEA